MLVENRFDAWNVLEEEGKRWRPREAFLYITCSRSIVLRMKTTVRFIWGKVITAQKGKKSNRRRAAVAGSGLVLAFGPVSFFFVLSSFLFLFLLFELTFEISFDSNNFRNF